VGYAVALFKFGKDGACLCQKLPPLFFRKQSQQRVQAGQAGLSPGETFRIGGQQRMKQPVFIFGQLFQAVLQPGHLASVGLEADHGGAGRKDAGGGVA
jgi:hypothetical protein